MTDWNDPASQVTEHFTVKEACWLPSWGKLHQPSEVEQASLTRTCELMEKVRDFFGAPINVHCMIRPAAYNVAIGGAPKSAHIDGLACDFDVVGHNCDDARAALLLKIEELECRMEQMPGGNWVHLDLHPVISARYFKP